MAAVHRIRLHGPWHRQVVRPTAESGPRSGTDSASAAKVRMPAGWADDLGRDFAGTVRYTRQFHCPTGIDATTPIHLVLTEVVGRGTVDLDDQQLHEFSWPDMPARVDLTGRLQGRHCLTVQIDALPRSTLLDNSPPADGGIVGEVRLEIG